jgi:adenine-specific DNA glycosylase
MLEKTLCGGQVEFSVSKEVNLVSSVFKDITPSPKCMSCPLSPVCTLTHSDENKVLLKAFTGMPIGYFPIHKETKTIIEIQTAKDILKFDKKTLTQVNAKNKKYANKIEFEGK